VTEVTLPEKKYTLEMIGEALREMGVLVIVFVPLYELFEHEHPSWYIVLLLIFIGIGCLLTGIEVERRRA
jgi:hypothetical protein